MKNSTVTALFAFGLGLGAISNAAPNSDKPWDVTSIYQGTEVEVLKDPTKPKGKNNPVVRTEDHVDPTKSMGCFVRFTHNRDNTYSYDFCDTTPQQNCGCDASFDPPGNGTSSGRNACLPIDPTVASFTQADLDRAVATLTPAEQKAVASVGGGLGVMALGVFGPYAAAAGTIGGVAAATTFAPVTVMACIGGGAAAYFGNNYKQDAQECAKSITALKHAQNKNVYVQGRPVCEIANFYQAFLHKASRENKNLRNDQDMPNPMFPAHSGWDPTHANGSGN